MREKADNLLGIGKKLRAARATAQATAYRIGPSGHRTIARPEVVARARTRPTDRDRVAQWEANNARMVREKSEREAAAVANAIALGRGWTGL